ncbi:winged helix-turn-helix transcriptional regulator [Croceitalea rosinachiae]|uniref:Helix-turn-helix domain-containing protein n=1 Tax=Croceitalea rosinachiae TaxID=3075596 RepID=A0ABU3ADS8_9FLAO|nr:helix-turn-helix domain-containing protein [Croceitalea sp. F388]MDT0608144.1 helix-turn-helix domain-containing protein [Croceitalea sp. F388]
MKNSKSDCPINQALEVFGDKWTLLIIRDVMFDGKRYFREMLGSDEKIASNILTDRLNKLEQFGILVKTKDEHHKQKNVYSLTEKGIDLMPVMIDIAHWSTKHREVSEKDRTHVNELVSGGQKLQNKMQNELKKELELVLEK